MYVNASIDACDLEDFSVDDVVYLYEELDTEEQELFLNKIGKNKSIINKIKDLFFLLNNDEALSLLKELNESFKSDKEWQETIKSINGDER
ncbi:hypothetical protein [Campylobacter sp. US33a]|uniref:hypothetical protein n=1 Tax=Campylobacter sp. US33a TaxID=2498120 RepID=UPI00106771F1|nr:hypothetical protein [Campylobacter sp. US33a]TEY01261.1 hypothetical protein ELQ16_07835 [Campylobacter sp. US33a]